MSVVQGVELGMARSSAATQRNVGKGRMRTKPSGRAPGGAVAAEAAGGPWAQAADAGVELRTRA